MRNFPAQVGPGGEPVSDSTSFTSSNANDVIQEHQNAVLSSGQTLIPIANPADNTQVSQAMARYASGGTFGVDSGAANAYVVSATGTFTLPDAYFDGMIVRFRAGNANTGGSTINAFGIGVVDLVAQDGSALTAGTITTGEDTVARYDSGLGDFVVVEAGGITATAALPTSFVQGLTTANAADADHDITVAVGSARDDADGDNITLASAITKQIDAAWSVGNNAGGLDTGTVAIDTWYYVWLIKRSDTGVVDALFSASSSAPTMPTNYDTKRLIGFALTDGSANIIGYTQNNNYWMWNTLPLDEITTAGGTVAVTITLSVPAGFKVLAKVNFMADGVYGYISSLDQDDQAPAASVSPLATVRGNAILMPTQAEVWTNTSSQVRRRLSGNDDTGTATIGWFIERSTL